MARRHMLVNRLCAIRNGPLMVVRRSLLIPLGVSGARCLVGLLPCDVRFLVSLLSPKKYYRLHRFEAGVDGPDLRGAGLCSFSSNSVILVMLELEDLSHRPQGTRSGDKYHNLSGITAGPWLHLYVPSLGIHLVSRTDFLKMGKIARSTSSMSSLSSKGIHPTELTYVFVIYARSIVERGITRAAGYSL